VGEWKIKLIFIQQPNNSLECSVLRIIIPNEYNGSIQTKAIPVRPHTTTRDVCRIIAHKSQITNPMDYGLFKLIDGEGKYLIKEFFLSYVWAGKVEAVPNDLFIHSVSCFFYTFPFSFSPLQSFINLETLLMDNDCPQDIRLASAGKHCTLVFRRFDSKIAWPKQ
jgi:Ras and Rab interactor 2/3